MKFKIQDNTIEHKWFAWYPIKVNNTLVWLETINRKYVCNVSVDSSCNPHWKYSFTDSKSNTLITYRDDIRKIS